MFMLNVPLHSLSFSPPPPSQAYYFEENDSDDQSVSDISPLIRRPAPAGSSTPHTHIVTGYLSVVEVLLLVSICIVALGLIHSLNTCVRSV